jgi:hypothetical protein
MINVSHIPDLRVGDEVVLIGSQGGETITAEEVAERLGTINYEVVSVIMARVPLCLSRGKRVAGRLLEKLSSGAVYDSHSALIFLLNSSNSWRD